MIKNQKYLIHARIQYSAFEFDVYIGAVHYFPFKITAIVNGFVQRASNFSAVFSIHLFFGSKVLALSFLRKL